MKALFILLFSFLVLADQPVTQSAVDEAGGGQEKTVSDKEPSQARPYGYKALSQCFIESYEKCRSDWSTCYKPLVGSQDFQKAMKCSIVYIDCVDAFFKDCG